MSNVAHATLDERTLASIDLHTRRIDVGILRHPAGGSSVVIRSSAKSDSTKCSYVIVPRSRLAEVIEALTFAERTLAKERT